MKLLLTSGGLRNKTLVDTFLELVNLDPKDIKVAFIPTAMNVEPGDKGWVITQLTRLQDIGVGQIDIVDVSAVPKNVWLPRIEEANVIFVNGGSTTYLMNSFNESGFSEVLPKLLETRIYVGVSAGSYIATPDLRFNSDGVKEIQPGFNFVNFGLQVHYKNPDFPLAESFETVKKRVEGCPYVVYALDDQMAVKIVDEKMEILGEGVFETFKNQGF